MVEREQYRIQCEWGLAGLRALAPLSDAVAIADVLSFSTAVDIAVARGATILPSLWRDDSESARSRSVGYSLSPASLLAIPPGTALVLPSPNGSALSLHGSDIPTYTVCLRNCEAVAAKLSAYERVAVIPAGEKWPDGSLRPCLEDWICAGALIAALAGKRSPEAELAVAAFERFRGDLGAALADCVSGRELIDRGFARDVDLAAEYAVSSAVPILTADRYVNAVRSPEL